MAPTMNLEQRLQQLKTKAVAAGIKLSPVKDYPPRNLPGLNPINHPALKLPPSKWKIYTTLTRFTKLQIILGICFGIITSLLTPLVAKTVGDTLDIGSETGIGTELYGALAWLGTLIILTGFSLAIHAIFESGVWQGTYTNVSYSLYTAVLKKVLSTKGNLTTGETLTTLSSDPAQAAGLQTQIVSFISVISGIGFIAYLMFTTSIPLALTVLIGVPVMLGLLSLIVPKLAKRRSEQRELQGKLASLTTDMLSGLRVVRGLGSEAQFQRDYNALNQQVTQASIKVAAPAALLQTVEQTLPALLSIIIISYGATLVYAAELTPGQLLSFYGYAMLLAQPMRVFSWLMSTYARAKISLEKFEKILTVTPVIADAQVTTSQINWAQAEIKEKTSGITINPTEITALVGNNPVTTARLAESLGRLNTSETITIDGHNLLEIPIREIRKHLITSVATNHIFAGTLRDNVAGATKRTWPARNVKEDIWTDEIERVLLTETHSAPAWPDENDTQILNALNAADAHDILSSLSGGLDGLISEKGRSVSGGQRQRIALARALYANPDILILIEPTSAVDSHTESNITQKLSQWRKGKTTIIVTTSPLLLEHCDRVIVLNTPATNPTQPTAIGSGTHQQLLNETTQAGELYRQIVSRATGTEKSPTK